MFPDGHLGVTSRCEQASFAGRLDHAAQFAHCPEKYPSWSGPLHVPLRGCQVRPFGQPRKIWMIRSGKSVIA